MNLRPGIMIKEADRQQCDKHGKQSEPGGVIGRVVAAPEGLESRNQPGGDSD